MGKDTQNIGRRLTDRWKKGNFFQALFRAMYNQLVRRIRHHDIHYFLDPERVMNKRVLGLFTPIGKEQIAVGNYYLDRRMSLNENSIVYSVGILTDIDFDQAVVSNYGCPVYMFDPTPVSIDFMKTFESQEKLKFFPYGVWTEDTTLRFYFPRHGGSASVVDQEDQGAYFDAECKSLRTLMDTHHHDQIDVLKMDIEGAALPIVEKMLEEGIHPNQLVVEFERPKNDMAKNIDFFNRILSLKSKFEMLGYESYRLPRYKYKYYSLELLFVRIHPQ